VTDTGTYLGVEKSDKKDSVNQIKMPNYINKEVESSKAYLESKKN